MKHYLVNNFSWLNHCPSFQENLPSLIEISNQRTSWWKEIWLAPSLILAYASSMRLKLTLLSYPTTPKLAPKGTCLQSCSMRPSIRSILTLGRGQMSTLWVWFFGRWAGDAMAEEFGRRNSNCPTLMWSNLIQVWMRWKLLFATRRSGLLALTGGMPLRYSYFSQS